MPSTVNGVVSKIIVKEGETVELDAILAILEEGAAAAEKNELSNDKTSEKNIAEHTKSVKNSPSAEKPYAFNGIRRKSKNDEIKTNNSPKA